MGGPAPVGTASGRPLQAARPLRILMVAARYLPFSGGIETHIREVGSRMAAQGHTVGVLTADPAGTLPPRERVDGMEVVRVRSWPKGRDWCLAPGLYTTLARSEGWDVVHVQGYHTFSAPFGMAGALRAGVPFVLTFHSGGHSSRLRSAIRGAQQSMLGPLARRAAQLVGVSEFEADHFSRTMRIDRGRFIVVRNGAQLPEPVAAAPEVPGEGPLVVSLGRLERYKGHHRAIAAFASLRETHPNARLRILGEGPYEAALRKLVERHGLGGAVTIGGIPARARGEMARVLQSAALVVLLSDYEAHPVAVMEALSLGRRVVTGDTSGFRELAALGLVRAVALDTPPAAVARVLAEEMAKSSDRRTIPLPDWDDCAGRLVTIYRDVAGMAAPSPEAAADLSLPATVVGAP